MRSPSPTWSSIRSQTLEFSRRRKESWSIRWKKMLSKTKPDGFGFFPQATNDSSRGRLATLPMRNMSRVWQSHMYHAISEAYYMYVPFIAIPSKAGPSIMLKSFPKVGNHLSQSLLHPQSRLPLYWVFYSENLRPTSASTSRTVRKQIFWIHF